MFCSLSWDYFKWIVCFYVMCNFIGIFGTVIQWRPRQEKVLREFLSHEVVIPKVSHGHRSIFTTKTQNGHLGAITLTLQTFNLSLVVDLQINSNLFASSYIEKHFADDGREMLINTTNHHHHHCYYHGRLRDDPDSTVAISTCHGIKGTLFTNLGTFHIEPTNSVINGHHFVFNDIHQQPKNLKCGDDHVIFTGFNHKYKRPTRLKRSTIEGWPYDSNSKTRVVEMYVVNDKTEYDAYDQDLSQVIGRTKDIINIVSSLYRPINIYIALVGIEVWTDKDKIDVVVSPDNTMNNFLTYRRTHIKQPNDNAQLITGKQLGSGVVGKAPIMTICSWQYSGGVNNDHNLVVGPVATTVAHELGHNFGLSHDVDKCGCPDDRCIMAASSGGINNPTKWSQCSKRQFEDAFLQGMDYCLTNLPGSLYGPATCGNGFLEPGEECDCGLSNDCNTACCDSFTCRLTENATCATGACCDLEKCKPKRAASVCRPAVGPCDLPETCSGKSEFCPSDYYVADGSHCSTPFGDSYCYAGKCSTHEGQCQLLWGRTGHKSNDGCYEHFNVMGSASGHCGFNWIGTQFTPCKRNDVKCGMLHCSHRNEKLMFWKEALSYTMPEGSITINQNNQHIRQDCMGAILDVGLDMPDPGMVPNGAMCDTGKICVAQQCVGVGSLDVLPCPDCHGHGVCNNIGECHCDNGYDPPYCNQPGNGGSLSSGPMEVNNNNVSLIIGLCVFFLIILPLLVVAGYYGYKNRESLKKILLQGPSERYRSIYRAKPRNDAVNHVEVQNHIVTNKASAVSNHANNVSPAPVHSYSQPPATNRTRVKRSQSYRTQDISKPQFEFSTNNKLKGIPTLRHSISSFPEGPLAHTPTRSAPRAPPMSDGAAPPGRPPPPRDGFIRNLPSPRAKHPLPESPYNKTEASRPVTLGLIGGSSEGNYQNTPIYEHDETQPYGFSDIPLETPENNLPFNLSRKSHNEDSGRIPTKSVRENTVHNDPLQNRTPGQGLCNTNKPVEQNQSVIDMMKSKFEKKDDNSSLNSTPVRKSPPAVSNNKSSNSSVRAGKSFSGVMDKSNSGPKPSSTRFAKDSTFQESKTSGPTPKTVNQPKMYNNDKFHVSRSVSDAKPTTSKKPSLLKSNSTARPTSKPAPPPKPGVNLSNSNSDDVC